MKTYDHFDSRNGLSDLENHTLDTKQTSLAASYPILDNRSKFGRIWPRFRQFFFPDCQFLIAIHQKKALDKGYSMVYCAVK